MSHPDWSQLLPNCLHLTADWQWHQTRDDGHFVCAQCGTPSAFALASDIADIVLTEAINAQRRKEREW